MTVPRYSCPFIIHFPEIKTNRKPYKTMNTDYLDGIIPFITGSYHIISKNSGMINEWTLMPGNQIISGHPVYNSYFIYILGDFIVRLVNKIAGYCYPSYAYDSVQALRFLAILFWLPFPLVCA